jgi:hypothetical protein
MVLRVTALSVCAEFAVRNLALLFAQFEASAQKYVGEFRALLAQMRARLSLKGTHRGVPLCPLPEISLSLDLRTRFTKRDIRPICIRQLRIRPSPNMSQNKVADWPSKPVGS